MKDKLKDEQHFDKWISEFNENSEVVKKMILNGEIPDERINFIKQSLVQTSMNILLCKYSSSKPIDDLKYDLLNAINLTNESWNGFWLIKTGNPIGSVILNQYGLTAYDQMLWMLSLGYLLDISNKDYKKLLDVIDRDGVKDFLYEFIIRAKIKERGYITKESYKEFLGVPQSYDKLRQATIESVKIDAEKLLKEFITKDWYNNHREAAWYNSHKSKHNTYFGYWSFETAAVVKIMGLDDSSFRDCQYYPGDLVTFS